MYGWFITDVNRDFLDTDELGTLGPSNILPSIEEELKNGNGETFKMYDDDGEWYYTGLIYGEFDGLEPLDDFGMPNAGCTEIRMLKDGKWELV